MIQYRSGYKYQLAADYVVQLPEISGRDTGCDYIRLRGPELTIRDGYAWDGPSGPTIDTKNFMRGSLVHDALYQLIRRYLLPLHFREAADQVLRRLCLEDGMSAIRAWWVYHGVRIGGGPSADPTVGDRPVLFAPENEK